MSRHAGRRRDWHRTFNSPADQGRTLEQSENQCNLMKNDLPYSLAAAQCAGWVAIPADSDVLDPSGFWALCRSARVPYIAAYVADRAGLLVIDVNGSGVNGSALRIALYRLWAEMLEEREPNRFLGEWITLGSLRKRVRDVQRLVAELAAPPAVRARS